LFSLTQTLSRHYLYRDVKQRPTKKEDEEEEEEKTNETMSFKKPKRKKSIFLLCVKFISVTVDRRHRYIRDNV
jgi:hypothetical protein